MKLMIAITSGIIFVLGTAQAYLVAKFIPTQVASQFFFLQSFILFAVTVGSSTIMIKNFAKVESEEKSFNLFFPLYQVAMTLILVLGSALYLLVATPTLPIVVVIIVVSAILNANTSITSFLRLYDRAFVLTQWLRVVMLSLKLAILFSLPLSQITLVQLLLVFLLADSLTIMALLFLFYGQRRYFSYVHDRKGAERGALGWGSLNATLRNLPRLMVFFIAERYYSTQALIDLRLLLLARENLASMMSIINLVFYREIFEHSKRLVFFTMFSLSMVFQLGFIWAMNLAGLTLVLSLEVVLFYASASAVYGVVQQHWGIVKDNKERVQFTITATAMAAMIGTVALAFGLSMQLNLLSYLTVFNLVWGGMITLAAVQMSKLVSDRSEAASSQKKAVVQTKT